MCQNNMIHIFKFMIFRVSCFVNEYVNCLQKGEKGNGINSEVQYILNDL